VKSFGAMFAIALMTSALASHAAPPSPSPMPAPSAPATSAQMDAVLKELKDIKALLAAARKEEKGGDDAPVHIADSNYAVLGSPDARVTLVEYTDYQCPFCKRFHDQSWPEIKRLYVDTGKVRFFVRDLPLDFHQQAMPSALAARCAAEQGKFWPVYETMLATADLSKDAPRRIALASGIDVATFDACQQNPGIRRAIENDTAEAERIGVTGTPGFVIAERHDGALEGTLLLGAQPTAAFTSRIDTVLNRAAH
jgi:protein-disulfide isomerase